MPSHYTEFVKANYSNVKDLPVKERFAALATMWNKQKVNVDVKDIKKDKVKAVKADKADKPKKVKKAVAKGGAFIPEQSPSKSSVISVLDALKSNKIERGGYQGFQGHYEDAVNQSTLQQLIKKH